MFTAYIIDAGREDEDAESRRPGKGMPEAMTAVVAVFRLQGSIGLRQAQNLGASYTHLGVRKIQVNENQGAIAVEYDATRMDQPGVAALLRRLGIPISGPATP
jgi:hypothetical protein